MISNCFFAPLILHERFRTQDIFGIGLAIFGAVTVVYASQSSSARFDPDALIYALARIPFLIWAGLNIVAIVFLSIISRRRGRFERAGWVSGDRLALIDVGLCALFGEWLSTCLIGQSNERLYIRRVHGVINQSRKLTIEH